MKKDIIVTAKTVEEAALEGASQLGVNREDITLDILEEPKKGFLGTWWGRLLVGLVIIILVLAAVIATAGQHTSHALTPAFMQFADFALEQACGFNIS